MKIKSFETKETPGSLRVTVLTECGQLFMKFADHSTEEPPEWVNISSDLTQAGEETK